MATRSKKHVLESRISRLEKFRLYETATMFYLVGTNELESAYRLLKINRVIANPKMLSEIAREDPLIYSGSELSDMLDMIHEGNKASGGLTKVCTACGVVGFVKFLNGYYLTLITQKKEVGCIAGNFIYTIKATEMFPIKPRPPRESNALKSLWKSLNKRISQTTSEIAENRYLGLFQFIDMTKDFFFSYSYDLTHSLQYNYIAAKNGNVAPPLEMFEWNYYQINEFRNILGSISASQWTMPIIHGSFEQKRFSQLGSTMDLILMARRSRHYAGTRYLKRGLNVSGKVANDCEVEQILQFDEGADVKFCSYVQMRGSIPTYWHQETSVTMPKPPILINRVDPDYLASQEHFVDMFRRYGSPIIVLDLVKQLERRPRESIVGREFRAAVETLNESIAMRHKIRYVALDYSKITSISKGKFTKAKTHKQGGFFKKGDKERATAAVGDEWNAMEKSLVRTVTLTDTPVKAPLDQTLTKFDDPKRVASPAPFAAAPRSALDILEDVSAVESKIDVLRELEDVASLSIQETGFFCNAIQFTERMEHVLDTKMVEGAVQNNMLIQSGVLRTNCIDCLDRTNGGQFAVGLYFLRVSLYTLGLRNGYSKNIEIHKDPMLLMLMEMYGEMADKIALQYGGSEAHKKVIAGKSVASNNSKQNELLTSIKRYYSNAFTDMVKQDAMNVFLGCFVPSESGIPLWDLESDYHLHNMTLHPPKPPIYRLLYQDVVADSLKLREGGLRIKLDSLVKKIVQKMIILSASSNDPTQGVAQLQAQLAKSDEFVVDGVRLTVQQCERMLKRYYMRFVAQTSLTNDLNLSTARSEPVRVLPSSPPASLSATPPPSAPAPTASTPLTPSASVSSLASSSKKRRNPIAATASNLTRLERRRLMRCIVATKVARASQAWWQAAIHEFNYANSVHMFGSGHDEGVDLDLDTELAMNTMLDKYNNVYFNASPDEMLPAESYFSRYYRPHELTDFDALLQMDFFAVTEVSYNNNYSLSGDNSAPAGGDMSILSNILYYPNLLTSAVVGHKPDSEAVADNEEIAEAVAGLAEINKVSQDTDVDPNNPTTAATNGNSNGPSASGRYLAEEELYAYDIPVSRSSPPTSIPASSTRAAQATNTFTLGKYVREIGMKAQKLVGGFLRKEDAVTAALGANAKRGGFTGGATQRFHTSNSAITQLLSAAPKASQVLYANYAATHADNTLLLYDAFTHNPLDAAILANVSHNHVIYDVIAVKEEYKTLLKDISIHIDDVASMEQLAKDAFVSREVSKGVFAGLPQSYSASLAQLYLLLSVEFMNSELLSFGNFVDMQYNMSRVAADQTTAVGLEKARTAHSRVLQSHMSSGDVYNVNVLAAATSAPDQVYNMNHLNNVDYSKRRDAIAKTLSVEVTNKLQERVRDTIANQNRFHNSNFRQHFNSSPSVADIGRAPAAAAGTEVVAPGLENELRKLVNNHIFQQYTYSKDISMDRLALRVSSLTSESSVTSYVGQFDYDYLASDLGSVLYILKDSSAFYTGFKEMAFLQRRLDSTVKLLQHKKRLLLQHPLTQVKDLSKQSSPKVTVRESKASRRKSYRQVRKDVVEKERLMKGRCSASPAASSSPEIKRSASVYSSKYGAPSAGQGGLQSISAQLGIYNAILEEDLRTDFTLSLHCASTDQPHAASCPFAAFPYNQESYRIADHDYIGFVQLAPDVYSRSTNPHLQLNEVGAMRFQSSLRRQELAVLDDLTAY